MKKQLGVISVVMLSIVTLFTLSAFATDAQMYFSSDKNGQNRVTNIQEGDEVWIVIIDNDENIDCDVRDKIWTDLKVFDPKTGAYIVWVSYMDAFGDATGDFYDTPAVPGGIDGYIPYKGHAPGNSAGWLNGDYLEETGADTGVFVSKRSFQVGTRLDYQTPQTNTHVVDNSIRGVAPAAGFPWDFQGGHYLYSGNAFPPPGVAGQRGVFIDNFEGNWISMLFVAYGLMDTFLTGDLPLPDPRLVAGNYLIGRFENMDTLVGLYQDQNDPTDVALGLMKIIDTEATIAWDQEIYKDANASASITVQDPDENLNCNQVEYVPVFVIVNPGSWNPVNMNPAPGGWNAGLFPSPNSFCTLKLTGGVEPDGGPGQAPGVPAGTIEPLRWFNWYFSQVPALTYTAADILNLQPQDLGAYYMQYPVQGVPPVNVVTFDTTDPFGFVRVSFYAQETGVNTGIFQFNINSLLDDLGFNQLNVRDVLVAYYNDPNDDDDFKLATAYIEERQHSITSFTDENRADKDLFWIGRDPVYVQVIDANANVDPCCPEQVVVNVCDPHHEDDWEWLILDETSSNSPVFFTFAGTQLWPVWDALGVGLGLANVGGFQLRLDNWKLEVFNEDDLYARYNDVYYELGAAGMSGLGDSNIATAGPPQIDRVRVGNDVSFDVMSIGDTQVYDGSTTNMYFLDRQGNRVSGYVNSDCVFVEVIDPDQDEDQYRRERIDAFWDDGQNQPFGPADMEDNHAVCGFWDNIPHPINALLGDTNIFSGPGIAAQGDFAVDFRDGAPGAFSDTSWAQLYVLNPRNGHWASVDLLETGTATGDFVSVTCIDLTAVYECVPSLAVLPGDTLLAVYQDPSNHSDSAWISIKVGIGGGGTPPSQQSTTMFVDAEGNEVANYTDADTAYVKVIDPSHAGAALLANAVEIDGATYDVTPFGASDTFITAALDLGLAAGDTITATYVDPTDLTDTSDDTITIIASVLMIDSFYAGPNPFDAEVTFGFNGTGIATTMSVAIYNLAGGLVWETTLADVTEITWDGAGLANGAYIYVITATDGTSTYSDTGKVFINR